MTEYLDSDGEECVGIDDHATSDDRHSGMRKEKTSFMNRNSSIGLMRDRAVNANLRLQNMRQHTIKRCVALVRRTLLSQISIDLDWKNINHNWTE